jgi:integrase
MANNFSKKFIESLKPKAKEYWEREGKGFIIRVYPTGIKAWYFIYTFEGRKRYMLLGNYPEVSIEDARERYGDAWKLLKNGKDPSVKAKEAKDERLTAPTIEYLATDYLEKYAKKQKKSWREDERMLNKDVIPYWGKIKAVDIKKSDVSLLLDKVSDRSAPVMANRLYALIKKMFNYAIDKGMLEFSPCSTVKRPHKEAPKDRALSHDEIKTLWNNLSKPDIIMTSDVKKAIQLILVTGQRPGEVVGMHSKEINDRWWTIPSSRTKNHRIHRVYLTDLALSLIGDIKGRTYIFPSPLNTTIKANQKSNKTKKKALTNTEPEKIIDTHIGEKSLTCALRRNIKGQAYRKKIKRKANKKLPENPNRLELDHFSPHDLRHTAITLMSEAGVSHEYRERVANHSIGKMDTTYNQHDFAKEKQKALETLSNTIIELTTIKRPIRRFNPETGGTELIDYKDGNERYQL